MSGMAEGDRPCHGTPARSSDDVMQLNTARGCPGHEFCCWMMMIWYCPDSGCSLLQSAVDGTCIVTCAAIYHRTPQDIS